MNAVGLIVEYNPFHNGHLHHLNQAKIAAKADVVIAVMSGSFLQRGEPAIIDKYHRTKAALLSGVDIVLELPYVYAVQSSSLFAKGSVLSLHALGVQSICFGSESGNIDDFVQGYQRKKQYMDTYKTSLKTALNKGLSYPAASKMAYEKIGLAKDHFDLSQPNNVLGFSYVSEILDQHLPITPLTVQRIKSHHHDPDITDSISSATSIRNVLLHDSGKQNISKTMPAATITQLSDYRRITGLWHYWEQYFPLLQYRIQTMHLDELAETAGVDEGLEYRLKQSVSRVSSLHDWLQAIKTKRYTWTRLQRMFTHILTNTRKDEIKELTNTADIAYLRLLGFSKKGQLYLNQQKKHLTIPLVTSFSRKMHPMLLLEERATNAYYSILAPEPHQKLLQQDLKGPVQIGS